MEFDINLMFVSHFLKDHPIIEESIKYKIKYLNALEYFVNKYSAKNKFSVSALDNYKNVFLGVSKDSYTYRTQELKKMSKGVMGLKIKGFKFFTYRYAFICDCLFINAMMEPNKATSIINDIKFMCHKRHHRNLDRFFNYLYNDEESIQDLDKIKYQVKCWKINQRHIRQKQMTILTTATMSAGKSTLINTLVGKTVNRTMNDACTSKLHFVYNKPFEDGFNYKFDYDLNLNAGKKDLLTDDIDSKDNRIFASTYFRQLIKGSSRLCIIDTPGVNSSQNYDHAQITKESILNENYDKIVYIVNAENAGTDDDLKYLQFIYENVDKKKLIFVLNKLDRFRVPEDSIEESINNLKKDLNKIGWENPIICPVSSYVGGLAKKKMYGIDLNEDEEDEYKFLQMKFKKDEYNLSKFYSEDTLNKAIKNYSKHENYQINDLLVKCGVLCLEQIVMEGAEY
ncbi:dynamin family protein [Alkaliphilus peptidifermentans]|uniref:Dynamin family protein n=1 Tax=Alkaliphilus peptidifermentans DSM 18978 TaxID=1120976 RepID=A0A1G5EB72_9FIRM|nr:dynamin family protein [Alkaliphilus peptidifermentans]SCY24212.1 Dynamin family protein [Alkaliphilus peptidifermentans DSM 18978]